jgi:uncharacterized protein (TIGR00730 family)
MRLCVFCGSSVGTRASYADAARELGEAFAEREIGLVYGGGRVGLMGIVADTALAAGGEVNGVIPQFLATREAAHDALTELRIVDSMHTRKAVIAQLSDGFIALPGGFGTLEEFCEIVTWSQIGLQSKPSGLVNVDGYFDPLLAMFDRAVVEGFVSARNRGLVVDAERPRALLDRIVPLARMSVG